jgi:uncharacterized damage-inducible protein DinB
VDSHLRPGKLPRRPGANPIASPREKGVAMSWSELLNREVEYNYKVAEGLFDMVDDSMLSWKPVTGDNWMTTAQLLKHISESCGMAFKGFVTGDWGMPEDFDPSQMKPEDMLPPAEKMLAVENVAEARKLLAEDKKTAQEMLKQCSEEDLANKIATAPWDPTEMILGHRLLQMVQHLTSHRNQLFYYLKLMGKPVNTHHMWGM